MYLNVLLLQLLYLNIVIKAQTAEELNAAKEEIKTVKNDLKSFYQKQLDAMLAEKVSDYQRKLDGIVQITNEENKLIKLQMNNQIINFKERLKRILNWFKNKKMYIIIFIQV